MRVLHLLDHGLPLHSGYAFRTRAILKAQLARGWDVAAVTGPRQGLRDSPEEIVDGLRFFRTAPVARAPTPILEWREIGAFARRIQAVAPAVRARPAPRAFAGARRDRRAARGAAAGAAVGL